MTAPALSTRSAQGGFFSTYRPPRTTPLGTFTPAGQPAAVELHARSQRDPVVVSVGLDAGLLTSLRDALAVSDDEDARDLTAGLDARLGRRTGPLQAARSMPDGVICDMDELAYQQALIACQDGERNWPNQTLPFFRLRERLIAARQA